MLGTEARLCVATGLFRFLGEGFAMQTGYVGGALSSFLGLRSRPNNPRITRQPPAALPRTDATPPANAAGGHAPVKPAAAAALIDPLVRTRVEKYGGAIAPEVVGQALSVEVPVKAHTRTVPAPPAVEKLLIVEPVTLDMLVAEFRKTQRITTQRVLLLGALCERWIRQQLLERTALDRATAVKKIRETLAEARLEKKEARVDLYVRCHWVAVLLGGWRDDSQECRVASNELAFSALRLFPILIERDPKSDRWQLTAKYAEAAKALWARAVKKRLPASVVNEELSKIVPARTIPIRKHRPVKLSFLLKLAPRLPIADVPTLITRLQEIQRQSLLPEAKSA